LVEQTAVNRPVTGSSPVCAAKQREETLRSTSMAKTVLNALEDAQRDEYRFEDLEDLSVFITQRVADHINRALKEMLDIDR
jgi:hypothetical protein